MKTGLKILATLFGLIVALLLGGRAIDLVFGLTFGFGWLIIIGAVFVFLFLRLGIWMERA